MVPVRWSRAVALIVIITLLTPLQLGASSIGSGDDDRELAFSPAGVGLELVEVAGGFDRPVYVTNAGDGSGRLFVVGLGGVVWVIEDGQVLDEPFLDVSDIVRDEDGEQGFFAITFHPEYEENGYFYAVYTKQPDGDNVLARFQVSADDPNRADPDSLYEILTLPDRIPNHNGGDIAFGPDGYLYYGTGDEGGGGDPYKHAQNPQSLFGKMLRLDVDGGEPYAIPEDNPFVDDPDVRDEIWALGLRNPFRYSFDPLTGDLYIGDVGQAMWEEVDFEPAGSPGGLNYGWPIMEGFACYPEDVTECDTEGLTMPILVYSHEGPRGVREGCSITGGRVYRGTEYPFMDGAYIFADWCEGRIWAGYRDSLGEWQKTEILDTFIMWTSIGADEAGELYGTDLIGGRVFRFVFTQDAPDAPVISRVSPPGIIAGQDGLALQVDGFGFTAESVVLWNDEPLETEFVTDTQLVASVPAALVAEVGDARVSVRDPERDERSAEVVILISDGPFADPAFEGVWDRTDRLVAEGAVSRTWIWGPEPQAAAFYEPYAESPDGRRMVLYFDKSRMEINQPGEESQDGWHVTNGLLVVEMMEGRIQVGDDEFIDAEPALINVAGDPSNRGGVNYAMLARLRFEEPHPEGEPITAYLDQDGTLSEVEPIDPSVTAGPLAEETGHRTASVFWEFMTSQAQVLVDGEVVDEALFENPYYATGLPITEAYWTTVAVGGTDHEVLLQCFERRCLTYTPAHEPGWQVEAGNVGQHYFIWRYGG